mgnify:CR=1 FL=1
MSSPSSGNLNLLDFKAKSIRTLHVTWFAFFMTFVLWFAHAPFKGALTKAFHLTDPQWKALLILNVALTIPARIIIGILVDKFGPRVTFSLLLMVSGVLCTCFALSNSFEMLALTRFLMGFAGAGFGGLATALRGFGPGALQHLPTLGDEQAMFLPVLGGQSGLFSILPLSSEQILKLREDHAIYMAGSGRINVAGLTMGNIDKFIAAVAAVSA